MTTMTATPAPVSTTRKARATKAAAPKLVTVPVGELRKNAARNADRTPDLGSFKAGDTVATADGREWTVAGPAQGGTTLKLIREQDGKKESVFRFARNITPVK